MIKENYYDLNIILRAANIGTVALTLVLYALRGGTEYIDLVTVLIFVAFGVQNHFLLLWENSDRDPCLILLMFTIIPFYMLRITTLLCGLYTWWDCPLKRYPFAPQDMNNSLLFIMLSVLCIAIGLKFDKIKYHLCERFRLAHPLGPPSAKHPRFPDTPTDIRQSEIKVIIIFAAVNLFDFMRLITNNAGLGVRFTGYLAATFSTDIVVLFATTYLCLYYKDMSPRYKKIIIILLGVFLAIRTMVGSRSALLSLALLFIYSSLAVHNHVRIKKRALIAGIAFVPIVFLIYGFATLLRDYKSWSSAKLDPTVVLKSYIDTVANASNKEKWQRFSQPFERIGYLDFAADIISNGNHYNKVINFNYYCRSIVDNVLTPGFDPNYKIPKAANSLQYIYHNLPIPRRPEIVKAYHADMFTVFGEYYVLFHGYPALIVLFISAVCLKKCFSLIRSKNEFFFYFYCALLFKIYIAWLWSCGLDWQIGEIVFLIINIIILKMLFWLNIQGPKMQQSTQ